MSSCAVLLCCAQAGAAAMMLPETCADLEPALAADPNLDMMFVGEEILHSARMWTHGYDIFSPDENLVSSSPCTSPAHTFVQHALPQYL